jgi:DNA-binding HxlR family transcriptional regulator
LPISRIVCTRLLWGQWNTPVLYLLGEKSPARFGEIQRLVIGISPKVLTQRLRELEADGLVWRAHEPTIPPKVTSGWPRWGQEVHTALKAFDAPAKRWFAAA